MSEHDDRFRDECGAYVLGALEAHEVAALRRHMESCVLCRYEVDRLAAVADVLGLGVPTLAAPPELRARVLDAVRSEASLFEAATASRTPARRWGLPALRPLGGLVAAALALGIVLGALVIAPGGALTRTISASVAPASRWHVSPPPVAVLHESGSQGELVLTNLPLAPRDRIYEVWIRRGGVAKAADVLFNATSEGTAIVAVPDLGGASAVMVTAERSGGASAPTMKPLILAQLG